jgi:hypothetical protein
VKTRPHAGGQTDHQKRQLGGHHPHCRRTVAEYVEHCHGEQNHQGLENRLLSDLPVVKMTSRVQRRPRLGGLLNFYERVA